MANNKNKSKLKIDPEPFKSSYLAIPPSPFSPRTPIALLSNPFPRHTKTYPAPDVTATPPSPLQWMWQCHQCRRTYSLGVTRRCLEDGHHFCAGTTTVKMWRKPLRPGKVRRHRACASEFDYQGWKTWGRWRRSGRRESVYHGSAASSASSSEYSSEEYTESEVENRIESGRRTRRLNAIPPAPLKDCWNACDYPSECRWGKRFGIHTPIATTFPTIEAPHPPPATAPSPASTPPIATTFEGILKPENCKEVKKERKADKTDFWGALVASATRRKSHPPSSPLASVSEELEPSNVLSLQKDGDGDGDGHVVMTSFDDVLKAPQAVATITPSTTSSVSAGRSTSTVVTLKEFVRKSSRKMNSSSKNSDEKEKVDRDGKEGLDATFGAFDFGISSRKEVADATVELAPLERMKSRDSGYASTPDLCGVYASR